MAAPPLLVVPQGLHLRMNFVDGEPPHWYAPLGDPEWLPPAEAAHMRPEDPVIGLVADGQPYALPWWVMKNHHVANVTLREGPLLVTLCERCSSAAAFDARLDDGRRLTFQMIGSYLGTHVVADYETVSVWTSFVGTCLFGSLRGRRLRRLPAYQGAWQQWLAHFPDSLVPDGRGESRDGHGADTYPGSLEKPLGKLERMDPRLPQNELVLGVEAGEASRAYTLPALTAAGGAVNDTIGGIEVVVFGVPGTWLAVAFRRTVDGRPLTFAGREPGSFEDRETGSRWTLTGAAVAGPLAGATLEFVPSGIEEWYVWAAYHPATDLAGER
jgi:hypothetical protein